jgi:hypothetical protein
MREPLGGEGEIERDIKVLPTRFLSASFHSTVTPSFTTRV